MLRRYDVIVVGGAAFLVTGFSGHGFKLSPPWSAAAWQSGSSTADPGAFDRTFFADERFGSDTSISTSYRYKDLGCPIRQQSARRHDTAR